MPRAEEEGLGPEVQGRPCSAKVLGPKGLGSVQFCGPLVAAGPSPVAPTSEPAESQVCQPANRGTLFATYQNAVEALCPARARINHLLHGAVAVHVSQGQPGDGRRQAVGVHDGVAVARLSGEADHDPG